LPNFNISNPTTVALEWPATRKVSTALSPTDATGVVIDCTVSQSVDRIKMFLRTTAGQWIDSTNAAYIIDVYDVTNMDAGVIKAAYSVPAADTTSSSWQRSDTGAFDVNRFQMVDEGIPFTAPPSGWQGNPPVVGDFIRSLSSTSLSSRIRFKGSTTFIAIDETLPTGTVVSLTGKRILDARVGAWFANGNGTGQPSRNPPPPPTVRALMFNGSIESVIGEANTSSAFLPIIEGQTYGVAFSMFGSAREWKNWRQPLTLVDVQTMLTSGTGGFGLAIDGQHNPFYLFAAQLEVSYCEEKRIATGFGTQLIDPSLNPRVVPAGGTPGNTQGPDGGWVNFPLVNPLTGAAVTWNKNAGNKYLLMLRTSPLTLPGNSWRALDTSLTFDHREDHLAGSEGVDVPLVDSAHIGWAGLPAASYTSPTVGGPWAPAYYLQNVTTVRSDSQPYADTLTVTLNNGIIQEQEFSTTGSLPYGMAAFLLLNDANAHLADAPLVASIIRRSDSTGLATGSATIDELLPGQAIDGLFHRVRIRFTSVPSLVPGTQYALRLTSAATVGGYSTQHLSAITAEAAAVGFGGTTNAMTVLGVELSYLDAIAGVTTVPPTLSGLSATNSAFDTDRAMTGDCIVPTVNYAALAWTASPLSDFEEYQIERNDDGTWVRIANIGTSFPATFRDFECRRNVPSQWRIRQVRTDGAWSDWSPFPTRTITANDYVCVLTNNQSGDSTLGLLDEPGQHYTRLATDRQVERTLYGRDKSLVFREAEDRGERFQRRFVLAWNDPTLVAFPTVSGRAVYDPLVTLVEDVTLPHVTLCDHRGRRWYTAATIQDLDHEEPAGRYFADVEFLEVAGPTPANLAFV
jgi:hypothetical protein